MFEELLARGGLSLDRLRTFCAIAEAGGIAKAAGNDPAKQSLFSRQVRELEEFFGVELTTREGKHIALTSAGERLARIANEHFHALSDFRHEFRSKPVVLRIAAGESVLEWLLLPKLSHIQRELPDVVIDLSSERTADVVRGLNELTIDLGIIRKNAIPPRMKSLPFGSFHYSLFVPVSLLPDATKCDARKLFATLPIATSKGGLFRELLEQGAAKAKIPLRIALVCSSFVQAASAVRTGKYAAILPNIAASALPSPDFVEVSLPFLKSCKRDLALVWNPRLANVRPVIEKSRDALMTSLSR